MSRELKVVTVTQKTTQVESVTWGDHPDVSVFLSFADDLRAAVDAGHISTNDTVRVREHSFHLWKVSSKDHVVMDATEVYEQASGVTGHLARAQVKAKAPSPASAIVRSADADEDRYAEMGSE